MTVGRQFALLRDPPSFGLLALATFASGIGTWLAFVALAVDVWDRTESATWVSALLIADFLPSIVIGVAASSLVDRMNRRRLMVPVPRATASASIEITRPIGMNTRRRNGSSTTSPTTCGGWPACRTRATASRTRPTWSPLGSKTARPATRAM